MHELPLTKSIFKTVVSNAENANAEKVTKVVLEVGVLRDFIPEMVQRYWDYIATGTVAEGARVVLREVAACAECGSCGRHYTVGRDNICSSKCPDCGYEYGRLLSGSELKIIGIEIVKRKDGTVS